MAEKKTVVVGDAFKEIPVDAPSAPKRSRDGKTLKMEGGQEFEVIRRYRDARGKVWCVVKAPMFVPGVKAGTIPKGAFLERHIPDPIAPENKREATPGITELEV